MVQTKFVLAKGDHVNHSRCREPGGARSGWRARQCTYSWRRIMGEREGTGRLGGGTLMNMGSVSGMSARWVLIAID